MKKTATASNGTTLEVGKKYRIDGLIGIKFIEILDIGINEVWTVNSLGGKYPYSIDKRFIPYEDPQPKPFEGYQKWYCVFNGITIVYAETKPLMQAGDCYSESEIIELGLNL